MGRPCLIPKVDSLQCLWILACPSCWRTLDIDPEETVHSSCCTRWLYQHDPLESVVSTRRLAIDHTPLFYLGSRLIPHLADIGTSSKQWGDGKNWFDEPDVCLGNVVRDNYIRTRVRHSTAEHMNTLAHRNHLSLSIYSKYNFNLIMSNQQSFYWPGFMIWSLRLDSNQALPCRSSSADFLLPCFC